MCGRYRFFLPTGQPHLRSEIVSFHIFPSQFPYINTFPHISSVRHILGGASCPILFPFPAISTRAVCGCMAAGKSRKHWVRSSPTIDIRTKYENRATLLKCLSLAPLFICALYQINDSINMPGWSWQRVSAIVYLCPTSLCCLQYWRVPLSQRLENCSASVELILGSAYWMMIVGGWENTVGCSTFIPSHNRMFWRVETPWIGEVFWSW